MAMPWEGQNDKSVNDLTRSAGARQRAEALGKLNAEYNTLLDPETMAEFRKQLTEKKADGTYTSADTVLAAAESAKEGVGIYGVRRANYELARAITDRPGARQTIMTSGQNTTAVGSTGLMQNVGKK